MCRRSMVDVKLLAQNIDTIDSSGEGTRQRLARSFRLLALMNNSNW